jgi:hypothetical protein
MAANEEQRRRMLAMLLRIPPKNALQRSAPQPTSNWLSKPLPMEGRFGLLPIKEEVPGMGPSLFNKRSAALPGLLAGAVNAFTAPGRAANAQPGFNAKQEGADFALNFMGGGLLGSRMAPLPRGAVGMNAASPAKSTKFVEPGFSGGRAFDDAADEDFVWVFHSTDDATANQFLKNGVDQSQKSVNPGVARGEVDYAPGRGAAPGLYVGGNTDIIPHSRRFLAIRVKKSDLAASPEALELGYKGPGGALNSQGALVSRAIRPEDIVDVTDPGMSPNMKKIREALSRR